MCHNISKVLFTMKKHLPLSISNQTSCQEQDRCSPRLLELGQIRDFNTGNMSPICGVHCLLNFVKNSEFQRCYSTFGTISVENRKCLTFPYFNNSQRLQVLLDNLGISLITFLAKSKLTKSITVLALYSLHTQNWLTSYKLTKTSKNISKAHCLSHLIFSSFFCKSAPKNADQMLS